MKNFDFDREDFLAFCFGIGCLVLLSAFIGMVMTDEYGVESSFKCSQYSTETGDCIKRKQVFSCRIQNGRRLLHCDTSKECSDFCLEASKGNK